MFNDDMTTLVSVIEKLRERNFDNEFTWTAEGFSLGAGKLYQPDELTIIKTYRFEGDSNPDDSSILYLIETNDGYTGYCIDAYGAATNHGEDFNNFIRNIPVKDREDQLIFDL